MRVCSRILGICGGLVVSSLVAPGAVWAQAASQAAPQAPAPAATPAATPVVWNAQTSVNFVHSSSSVDSTTVQINGVAIVQRARMRYLAYGDVMYSKVTFGSQSQTALDSDKIRFMASRQLTPRVYLLATAAAKRNAVQGVEHAYDQLAGAGVRFQRPGVLLFDVAGGVGFIEQQKHVPALDGTSPAFGALQTLSGTHGVWSFEQAIVLFQNAKHTDDYRFQFNATIAGRLFGPLGLNLTYQVDHENTVLLNGQPTTQTIMAGATLALPVRRAPAP